MTEEAGKAEAQQGAEAEVQEFREHLGPFVVAAETTRMPMVFTNAKEPENPIIFANDSFLSLSGYSREEALGNSFNSLLERGSDPEALAEIKAAFDIGLSIDRDLHYRRKDGSDLWVSIFISPVRDEKGDVVQNFVSFVDVTRHRERRARSEMLIDELNHRVKNTLATVQSIVSKALRSSGDVEVVREAIESRLFALSRSHDLLTRVQWESAGLRDIVTDALEPFGIGDGRAERFVITGPNVRFPPKGALALGVAFNELATNAVKYGAFSNEEGRIMVSWTVESDLGQGRLVLHWREEGGPPVTPPSRKGFGSQVIERGLAHELGGKVRLAYQPGGVICTIDVPAPNGGRDG